MPCYGLIHHLGQTQCVLCRQQAEDKCTILTPDEAESTVRQCDRSPCPHCLRTRNPSVWWHKSCYLILANSYKPEAVPTSHDVEILGRASIPLYLPLIDQDRYLASVREGLFSSDTKIPIRRELLEKLPAEILSMILEYVSSCRYLIILGESRRLIQQVRKEEWNRFNLRRGIYFTKLAYQGVDYVSRVSNTPVLPFSESSTAEFLPLPPDTHKIVLSKDHIGVRHIQFLSPSSHPPENECPWYEVIEVPKLTSNTEIDFLNSGLFLRSIQTSSNLAPRAPNREWSSPSPPKLQPWNSYSLKENPSSRLHHVKLNGTVQGLVVCRFSRRTIGVEAFSGVLSDYQNFVTRIEQKYPDHQALWMYFPLNAREAIRQIWVRQFGGSYGEGSDPVITLQTSRGRTIIFGPYAPPLLSRQLFRFHSLVKPGDGDISGICHNCWDPTSDYLSEIGVTCHSKCRGGGGDQTVKGFSEPEFRTRFDSYSFPPLSYPFSPYSYCMTKAPLQGLIDVQYCRDTESPHRLCIGLLLYYDGGSIESLGQIRWDREMSDRIPAPISIQRGSEGRRHHVKDVRAMTGPGSKEIGETEDWLDIPKHGTLIWWFTHIDDRLVVYER